MSGPRHGWIRRFVHDFEYNPTFQFKFHLGAIIFWWVNFVVGTLVMFLWPHLWIQIGVYYVFCLSLYANGDTDYDAMSASIAAIHGENILERIEQVIESRPEEVDVIIEEPGV